ncbi:MAG: 2-phospho-L-lactate transferase [Geodermatophilaceae bacterium]|nr:2-phospho-L-lactate transferase [Geodermatophilaceae bacterium]
MRVVVLAGGVGGARFLLGVRAVLKDQATHQNSTPDNLIQVIVNTGDDLTVHGLRVCPDLDTVMYTLGDGIDTERGWGRRAETWQAKEELTAYGAEPSWFGLGDRDIATHLIRTRMLDAGYPLSEVTAALCKRWQLCATGTRVQLLPMSDQRVETHVVCQIDGVRRVVHFQEWWIAHHAQPPVEEFVFVGLDQASAGPGILDAIADADAVLLAPSNPVVSIGPILAVPGLRQALRETSAKVVGLSPIVDGAVVRGMADKCLPAIGVPVSAEGVARHYGARKADGILDGWLVHETDAADVAGVEVGQIPLLMRSPEATAAMASAALDFCRC